MNPNRLHCRYKMASEQGVYDQSYIDSLKKDRKELIQKKSDISVFL